MRTDEELLDEVEEDAITTNQIVYVHYHRSIAQIANGGSRVGSKLD